MATDLTADITAFVAPLIAVLLTTWANVILWRRQSRQEWEQRRKEQADEWEQGRRDRADERRIRLEEKEEEGRKRREIVATELLTTLRWSERQLRALAQSEQAGNATATLLAPSDRNLDALPPATVRRLVEFRAQITHLQILLTTVRSRMAAGGQLRLFHHAVQTHAAFAVRMMPQIRIDLEAAGGLVVNEPLDVSVFPEVPELPPPVFPEDNVIPRSPALFQPGTDFMP